MDSAYSLTAQILQRPLAVPADSQHQEKLRLVADDKYELDQMIRSEQRRGWVLLSRSYSLDEGHGATLVLADLDKAA